MNETLLTEAIDRVISQKLKAVDAILEQLIEPLGELGNPEKLIGKKYEEWTPEDFQSMAKVYGQVEPNPLSNLIFKKEYEKIKVLEAEVGGA